ncbi:hypothetical protein U9M48_022305 [Paspalum notatum var. saurae]|uniref:Uncharacterized protein n=1 Tax=Paspalum notatum var. saurae TaxID=547442 RepID=A0AAQ3TI08_PASNO
MASVSRALRPRPRAALLEVSSRSLKIVDLEGREQESKSLTPTRAGSSRILGLGFRVQVNVNPSHEEAACD